MLATLTPAAHSCCFGHLREWAALTWACGAAQRKERLNQTLKVVRSHTSPWRFNALMRDSRPDSRSPPTGSFSPFHQHKLVEQL